MLDDGDSEAVAGTASFADVCESAADALGFEGSS